MTLSKPTGWRLVVLRTLQVVCLVTSPIVVARFLFSDVVWVTALVVDGIALAGVVLLYRSAGNGADKPSGDRIGGSGDGSG